MGRRMYSFARVSSSWCTSSAPSESSAESRKTGTILSTSQALFSLLQNREAPFARQLGGDEDDVGAAPRRELERIFAARRGHHDAAELVEPGLEFGAEVAVVLEQEDRRHASSVSEPTPSMPTPELTRMLPVFYVERSATCHTARTVHAPSSESRRIHGPYAVRASDAGELLAEWAEPTETWLDALEPPPSSRGPAALRGDALALALAALRGL